MPTFLEEGEDEPTQIPKGIPAPMPSPPEDDFFRYRIDGVDILDDIQHQLKGEVLVGAAYEEKFDRWINDEGINKVTAVLYSCGINKNIFLGNLTQDQILTKCEMIKTKLSLLLFKNYKKYEVEKDMRGLLITVIINQIHSALSRSEGGKEGEQLSTAAQRHDIYTYQEQNKRQGGGMLGRWLKRPRQPPPTPSM